MRPWVEPAIWPSVKRRVSQRAPTHCRSHLVPTLDSKGSQYRILSISFKKSPVANWATDSQTEGRFESPDYVRDMFFRACHKVVEHLPWAHKSRVYSLSLF